MNDTLRAWLRRPGIGRRIAATMVVSLIAVQAQAFVQVWLFARPEMQLTGTRWVAELVRDALHDTVLLPLDERAGRLHRLQEGTPFHLAWSATRPWAGPAQDAPVTARLVATLRDVLGRDAVRVDVTPSERFRLFKFDPLQVGIEPRSVMGRLGTTPIAADQPDVLMPLNTRIAIQATDGSWLSADPVGFDHAIMTVALPITALLGGGIIIALMSTLMARRIVAPLDRLIVAAEAIGTSPREIVAVRLEGLGEFAAVGRAFEDMQHRLTRFVGDRTQMLAAISHDLRSSLTRLRIAAENEAASEGRTAILAEIDDMDTMVGSTLSFATGEALTVPSRSIDIAALLISLVDNAADSGRPCEYEGPDHSETIGHPVSLKRAFSNLIDNAIKYGAAAHVALAGDDHVVRVVIADEGPGIPPELVEDSFKPFRRLDPARSGELRGSGLGLTIARDAVQSHGGTIHMRNRDGGGLSVVVELPRR